MADTFRIGTRGSRLALWQAEYVAERLRAAHPGLEVRVRTYRTTGDRDRATPLARLPGAGFFVKELEEALLADAIDLAVHSMKDVPTRLPAGLAVGAAVPERDDVRDCLVTPAGLALADLPAGAVVGTSSPRRRAMLAALAPKGSGHETRTASRYGSRRDPAVGQAGRPDLAFVDLRGNVETRLRKLADGVCDATVLAAAGLARLGARDARAVPLEPAVVLPAAGQGALGLEHRADDTAVRRRIAVLDHEPSRRAVVAERAVLARLEAGCRTPIGVLGRVQADGRLHLEAWLLAPDGSCGIRRNVVSAGDAAEAGARLAETMLADGAADLMRLEA